MMQLTDHTDPDKDGMRVAKQTSGTGKKTRWWVLGFPEDPPHDTVGPYDTKDEALKGQAGLRRFLKEIA